MVTLLLTEEDMKVMDNEEGGWPDTVVQGSDGTFYYVSIVPEMAPFFHFGCPNYPECEQGGCGNRYYDQKEKGQ